MSDLIFWFIAIDILEGIKHGLIFGFICAASLSFFRGFYNFVEEPKYDTKPPFIIAVILFSVMVLIPSSKTLYVVLGLSAGDKAFKEIAESKYAEQIKLILDSKLDSLTKELTTEKPHG